MPYRELYENEEFFTPNAFPVVVQRFPEHESMELHAHRFSELVIIFGGTGMHVTSTERYPLSAGDVFVISGQRKHGYKDTQDLYVVNILFEKDNLAFPTEDLRELAGYHALFNLEPSYRRRHGFKSRLHLSLDELAHIEGIIDQLEEELQGLQPGYRFLALGHFMNLVGHLSRIYEEQPAPSSRQLLRIGEAISYLEKHFSEDVSLEDLARMAHMSKRSFQRTFHEAIGTSPISYLIQLRVKRAAELLRNSELTIAEAAYTAGFQDSNYFSRKFRQIMGMNPGAFRKRQRLH